MHRLLLKKQIGLGAEFSWHPLRPQSLGGFRPIVRIIAHFEGAKPERNPPGFPRILLHSFGKQERSELTSPAGLQKAVPTELSQFESSRYRRGYLLREFRGKAPTQGVPSPGGVSFISPKVDGNP